MDADTEARSDMPEPHGPRGIESRPLIRCGIGEVSLRADEFDLEILMRRGVISKDKRACSMYSGFRSDAFVIWRQTHASACSAPSSGQEP